MPNNSYLTSPSTPSLDRRNPNYVFNAISEELRDLLCDPTFVSSISPPTSSTEDVESKERNNPLSLLLLNAMPDFLLVLSLKGLFLYIAPSVTHVQYWNTLPMSWLVNQSAITATLQMLFLSPVSSEKLQRSLAHRMHSIIHQILSTFQRQSTSSLGPGPNGVHISGSSVQGVYMWSQARGEK